MTKKFKYLVNLKKKKLIMSIFQFFCKILLFWVIKKETFLYLYYQTTFVTKINNLSLKREYAFNKVNFIAYRHIT